MRIGFFHEVQTGGARRSVIEFGKALGKNHTIDLFYVDSQRSSKDEHDFNNAYFYSFHSKKWTGKDWKTKLYKDTVEIYKLYRLHKKIADDINNKDYDVLFIDPSKYTQAPFILRLVKTKKAYYCQETLRMVYDPLLNTLDHIPNPRRVYESFNRNIRKEIDKGNLAFADTILANSRFSQRNIKDAYNRSSTVCYLGVDTQTFFPKKIKKDIDVLYVGAYDYVDGYNLFEKALSHFQKKPNIKVLAREKEWIADDSKLNDLYNRAKVTVCISYNEPFGLIPLESMSAGTPVIALSQGGYKESVLHGETGLLVKNNPKDLADAMKKLLKNKKMREQLSQNGRKAAIDVWDWQKRSKYLEKLLIGVANNEK